MVDIAAMTCCPPSLSRAQYFDKAYQSSNAADASTYVGVHELCHLTSAEPCDVGQHRTCLAQKTCESYNLIKVSVYVCTCVYVYACLCGRAHVCVCVDVCVLSVAMCLRVRVCAEGNTRVPGVMVWPVSWVLHAAIGTRWSK